MNSNLVREDKYENYLLVEGSDDKHVFRNLLLYYQVPQQLEIKSEHFEIKDHQGIDNLLNLRAFKAYLDEPRRRFGVIVDADTDLTTRWQKIRDILEKTGYSNVPLKPRLEGTIIKQDERPVVGIWLMPDNKIPGIIEDFVSLLVPPGDLLWPIAEDTLQKVVKVDRRFLEAHRIKAKLHTWLAWQEEPGKPMGLAITKRYLDPTAEHAQHFMDWIRKLFDLETA